MKSKTLFSLVVLTLFTSLIPAMHAQTYSVIHAFTGGTDGASALCGSDDTRATHSMERQVTTAAPSIS